MLISLVSSIGSPGTNLADRLKSVSGRYLGVRYRLDPLGEGSGVDRDPLFSRQAVDCQTFVEQVMAEALAPTAKSVDEVLRQLRYRDGTVGYEHRHHYCVPNWLESNWPIKNITHELGPTVSIRRRIQPSALLRRRGITSRVPDRDVQVRAIPRSRLPKVVWRDGTILALVVRQPDLVVGHLGFVFRSTTGVVTFRHASQTEKRVVDRPLAEYLKLLPRRFVGAMVLQPDPTRFQIPAAAPAPARNQLPDR